MCGGRDSQDRRGPAPQARFSLFQCALEYYYADVFITTPLSGFRSLITSNLPPLARVYNFRTVQQRGKHGHCETSKVADNGTLSLLLRLLHD